MVARQEPQTETLQWRDVRDGRDKKVHWNNYVDRKNLKEDWKQNHRGEERKENGYERHGRAECYTETALANWPAQGAYLTYLTIQG